MQRRLLPGEKAKTKIISCLQEIREGERGRERGGEKEERGKKREEEIRMKKG